MDKQESCCCGNQIIVAHGSNLYTGYYHLSGVLVKTGQKVTRGSRIGPKIVSLVPSEIASMPSSTTPLPIIELELSPVHTTTSTAGNP